MQLFESCFILDMPKHFHEKKNELLHLFQCLRVVEHAGIGFQNSIFKMWLDEGFVQGEILYNRGMMLESLTTFSVEKSVIIPLICKILNNIKEIFRSKHCRHIYAKLFYMFQRYTSLHLVIVAE